MGKVNARLDAARKTYREALEAARANPSPEAWARLLAAGKDLSTAEEPKPSRSGRRSRRTATPSIHELEGPPVAEASEAVEAGEAIEPAEAVDALENEPQDLDRVE